MAYAMCALGLLDGRVVYGYTAAASMLKGDLTIVHCGVRGTLVELRTRGGCVWNNLCPL